MTWLRLPRRAAWLVASTLGMLTHSSPVRAAPTPVVGVLELSADFDQVGVAQAFTNLLRLRIGDGADFLLASDNPSFLVIAPAVRCDTRGFRARPLRENADAGIDERCLRSVGAHLGAKRYFWGHLYQEANGQLGVKLHLWTDDTGDRSKALSLEGAGRERLVERLYVHLVHPELAADVRVRAGAGLEGELWVDGRTQGPYAPATELTLLAGEHRLEVRGGGKVLARGQTTVIAGRSTEVRLEAVAPVGLPAKVGITPPVRIEPTGSWQRPAGFVALGVGAALVGAGVFTSLRVNGLQDDFDSDPAFVAYRTAAQGPQDACDAAESDVLSPQTGAATPARVRRVCSGIATLHVAQLVLYGTGALGLGAGAYLLATSPSPKGTTAAHAAWSLRPWAGTSGGGVRVGLSF